MNQKQNSQKKNCLFILLDTDLMKESMKGHQVPIFTLEKILKNINYQELQTNGEKLKVAPLERSKNLF
jgi:hypothetical protein